MTFPTDFDDQTQPLPVEKLGEQGRQAVQDLADRGYEVHTGLTEGYATAIAEMCLEPSIKEYCPRDSGERFKDLSATARWLSKGRGMFLLLKREAGNLTLAGYGWGGAATSDHVPGGQSTFAIRISETAQGQGLAAPFTHLIVAGSAALYGATEMWSEAWQSNAGAVHVYQKVGFEIVDQETTERPTASGGTVSDTRFYMRIPNELLNA
jgi:ribosomal protein S18 acetylase RimI-like enzyme